jgi:hypothetical protein
MWYTVQAGESLSLIAQKYLGSLMLFNEIYEQNKDVLASPELVYAGTKIWIPIGGKSKPVFSTAAPVIMDREETYPESSPYRSTFDVSIPTRVGISKSEEAFENAIKLSDLAINKQPDGFLRITDPAKFNKMMTYGGIGLVAIAALLAFS